MKKIEEKECSSEWWRELEKIEEKSRDLNWCCKLVTQAGFDVFIQNEMGTNVALRLGLHYCPHCGKSLNHGTPLIQSKGCCYLFRDLGLEAMQFEEPCMQPCGEIDIVIHRLLMNYCFNCGREIKRNHSDNDGVSGTEDCNCGNCDEC
jgi:hypothetical protein